MSLSTLSKRACGRLPWRRRPTREDDDDVFFGGRAKSLFLGSSISEKERRSREDDEKSSINYTNLLLVTKETALAKYASLFGAPEEEEHRGKGGSKVRWDRLKLRHEAHENAVAKGTTV